MTSMDRSELTMSDEASKVPSNDAMPGSALPAVELDAGISDGAGGEE